MSAVLFTFSNYRSFYFTNGVVVSVIVWSDHSLVIMVVEGKVFMVVVETKRCLLGSGSCV